MQANDPVGDRGGALWRYEDARLEMSYLLGKTADTRGDNGKAGRHRLERAERERFLTRCQDEDFPTRERLGDGRAPDERDRPAKGRGSRELVDLLVELVVAPEAWLPHVLEANVRSGAKNDLRRAQKDVGALRAAHVADAPHDELAVVGGV